MIEWKYLLLVGSIIALIIRRLLRAPYKPEIFHSPYARPGSFKFEKKKGFFKRIRIIFFFLIYVDRFTGPWHLMKLISARIWLTRKLVRHPRELNIINTMSKKYENVGLVITDVENDWEQPKPLLNGEVI